MRSVTMLLSTALTLVLLTVPVSPARASGDGVDTGKTCNDAGGKYGYKANYRVKVKTKRPKLTHLQAHALPPTGKNSKVVTRESEWTRTLKVKVHYEGSAGLEASVKKLILAKAGTKAGFGLAGVGKRTETKTITVTSSYSNPTKKNQDFVAFAGRTQVKGTFRYRYCWRHRRAEPATIHYRDGRWKSYAVRGSGLVRCGAGEGSRGLTALALKHGCK